MISLSVVTNGPVAKAGFILKRFMVNGTKVPKNDAQITTVNNAILTVAANVQDSLISKLYPKITSCLISLAKRFTSFKTISAVQVRA